MYKPIKGGKGIELFGLECWIPPVPDRHLIQNYHLPKKEQYWRRTPLPTFQAQQIDIFSGEEYDPTEELTWDQVRREEIIKQRGEDPHTLDRKGNPQVIDIDIDPDYRQQVLTPFRQEWLTKCYPWPQTPDGTLVNHGHWFFNNGEPVWLSPFHVFYLNWWELDSGYATFRRSDWKKFYAWQYSWEDPVCFGITEASKRGEGKTYRAMSVAYQATIYKRNIRTGIQSKTEDDAEEAFKDKMVEPYKKLPDFFIPINNNPSDPGVDLSFFPPKKRGKSAEYHRKLYKNAINSKIDYKNSKPKAYDGTSIKGVLVLDEEGKTVECSVSERHSITRDCVFRDGKLFGKKYSTTTVDEMEKGGEEYEKVWKASNQWDRDELGMTKTGMYRIFLPADESQDFDIYGEPNKTENRRKILITRDSLAGDPIAQLKYILQNPLSESELFSSQALDCQYNLTILRQRERFIQESEKPTVRVGDFYFEDGIGSRSSWTDNPHNGKWHVSWLFEDPRDSNKVAKDIINGGPRYRPLNDMMFSAGFDPVKMGSKSVDKRRSQAGGAIYMKSNFWNPDFTDNFVADYVWEPDDPDQAWLDFLAGLFYYGCSSLPENNLGIPKRVSDDIGCDQFVMRRPESTFTNKNGNQDTLGMPGNEVTNDYLTRAKRRWVQIHGHKLLHPRITKDAIRYNPEKRTKFDLEVATQLALVGAEKKIYEEPAEVEAEELFDMWDNSGHNSKFA